MGRIDAYPDYDRFGAAGGTLGYAEVTANQGSITTEIDLTGLTATVTVPAGRRLKITGHCAFQNTGAGNRNILRIREDASQIQQKEVSSSVANQSQFITAEVIVSPTAGMHTYKLAALTTAGTTTMAAAAGTPAFILVEDITGTLWPGSTVTVGMLPTVPACRVFHSVDQLLTSGAGLFLAFNSERYDTDNMHDTAVNNSRITIQTAGLYLLTANVQIQNDVDTDHRHAHINIRLNGTTFIVATRVGRLDANIQPILNITTVYKFAAGDYVEVEAYQLNTDNDARPAQAIPQYSPEFSATYMGPG